ncbi:MAG: hypothetical protein AB7F93_12970 [Immundisolibacter sp.]|uniref:hypothetical protein n=1 Tax=Immundisolibacter sp. TaxID=1934948 RepID=UPI003D1425D6
MSITTEEDIKRWKPSRQFDLPPGLLPVSRTPSLGVMMKPEVAHGNETGVQPRVQA